MNKFFISGIAGFVALAVSVVYFFSWNRGIDLGRDFYPVSVALFAVGAVANVIYWYGLSLVGTKFRNIQLHYMALAALMLSILGDVSNVFFILFPQYAAHPGWGLYGFLSNAFMAVAFILTGLAIQRMKPLFGDITTWYAIGAMLSGVLLLSGDFGIATIYSFSQVLNILLYLFGGLLLLQAAKK